jgi:hypothetical protein
MGTTGMVTAAFAGLAALLAGSATGDALWTMLGVSPDAA